MRHITQIEVINHIGANFLQVSTPHGKFRVEFDEQFEDGQRVLVSYDPEDQYATVIQTEESKL